MEPNTRIDDFDADPARDDAAPADDHIDAPVPYGAESAGDDQVLAWARAL